MKIKKNAFSHINSFYVVGDCGGNYSGQESDIITSPNYPGKYLQTLFFSSLKSYRNLTLYL